MRRRSRTVGDTVIKSNRGNVITELSVVLPFFVLLFFGSLDVGRMIKLRQAASVVAREAANLTFRECLAGLPIRDSDEDLDDDLTECFGIDGPADWQKFQNIAANTLDNADLVVSVFQCETFECSGKVLPEEEKEVVKFEPLYRTGSGGGKPEKPEKGFCKCTKPYFKFSRETSPYAYTRYWSGSTPGGDAKTDKLEPLLKDLGVVVVAEVTTDMPLLLQPFMGERAYEATIF